MNSKIVGQPELTKRLIIALLSSGHLLVEGAPGLAKTTAIKTLSACIDCSYHRIQFTPDLLPADLTGTDIYIPEQQLFKFQQGPLFHNFLLADEINRAPAKVQSALLEAMGERQITIGKQTYQLPELFLVMATQNPIEQEGTYPLPEAQLDRFMFNVALNYPSFKEELQVVKNTTSSLKPEVNHLLNAEQIIYFQQLVRNIPVTDHVMEYAVKLVSKTRPNSEFTSPQIKKLLTWGAGPRASQFLILGAKCHAVINGKYAPDIEDVQAVAKPILRHRIVRSYHAEAEGLTADDIIQGLF
jgi:MoxR-like ATPase